MIKLERGAAPEFWTDEQVTIWTTRWQANTTWNWPTVDGKRLNAHAVEVMRHWHHDKCAFCEARKLKPDVEHFIPKTAENRQFAFVWSNLFLSCDDCNTDEKGAKHPENAIKPDVDDPEDFLWINPITLKVSARPDLNEIDKARAMKTIQLFGLNRDELTRAYQHHWRVIANYEGILPFHQVTTHPPIPLGWITNYVIQNQEMIDQHSASTEPYSLMVKSILRYVRQIHKTDHE